MLRRNHESTELRINGKQLRRIYGKPEGRNLEFMEKRNYGSAKRSYNIKESRKDESADVRKFEGQLKPLMTEVEKKDAQVLELSYDFSCRIIRLYKYLNEAQHPQSDADYSLGIQ